MIDTIILDLGDIFINLEKQKSIRSFKKLGLKGLNQDLITKNELFEKGKINEIEFIESFKRYLPGASTEAIVEAWNSIIGEFPLARLKFLQKLSSKYRLFLLTNTDSIHINHFKHKVGMSFYNDFYQCFEKIYFSYEMGMQKPEIEIFKTIIRERGLLPKQTLFVDDKKENTDAAELVGLQIWNLTVGHEDVVDLFNKKQLFF